MESTIIFYSAKKTAICEKTLKKILPALGLSVSRVSYATTAESLGDRICEAFELCDTALVIGGLGFGDLRNSEQIVARAVSAKKPEIYRRIENSRGDTAYLLDAGRQLMLLLPDDPEQLEELLGGIAGGYIKAKTA